MSRLTLPRPRHCIVALISFACMNVGDASLIWAVDAKGEHTRAITKTDPPQRVTRRLADDLTAIREHLLLVEPETRRNLRFFTLSHLANNHARYNERDLRLVRAAVAKLINSLHWTPELIVPEIVFGTDQSVLCIDLRDLKWSGAKQWLRIVNHYPYGLKYNFVEDLSVKQVAADVQQLSGAELPFIRADWFVFAAAQPPLYHALLELPQHSEQLEAKLGVDVKQNLIAGDASRAGFGRSTVSRQNRLLERHESRFGAYWISYDFLPRRGRGNLVRYPLGPTFDGNEYNRHAFEHNGGEAVFHLPNGLQGYFVRTANGDRRDGPAPAALVYDSHAIAGTPAIINGLSCMHCHREGMISDFEDEIRNSGALVGDPLEKLRRLYLPGDQMNRLVARDRQQFLTALATSTGPFLMIAEDSNRPITQFPEPIGEVAKHYLDDLGPHDIALELGVANIDVIRQQITDDRDLRKLGLGTLIQDKPGVIKRARWEAIDGTSFFQDVAVELRLGTPILPGTTHRSAH